MADFMRGMRWRAAWMVLALLLIIMWYTTFVGRGYIIRVDFAFAIPDAIGAEVLIDGEVVDTLHMLRRQPINGIPVERGPHRVELRSERCFGGTLDVDQMEREQSVSIFVHVMEHFRKDGYSCTLGLRR